MPEGYVIRIQNCDTFEQAEKRFRNSRRSAALIRFIDGTGGVAMLDSQPVFEGQRPFNAGRHEVRRKMIVADDVVFS